MTLFYLIAISVTQIHIKLRLLIGFMAQIWINKCPESVWFSLSLFIIIKHSKEKYMQNFDHLRHFLPEKPLPMWTAFKNTNLLRIFIRNVVINKVIDGNDCFYFICTEKCFKFNHIKNTLHSSTNCQCFPIMANFSI